MGYVSLDAAKALKAVGYPQDDCFCDVTDIPLRWFSCDEDGDAIFDCIPYKDDATYAAPDHLTALTWLESAHAYQWERVNDPGEAPMWLADIDPSQGRGPFALAHDPDVLIRAICAHLAAVAVV